MRCGRQQDDGGQDLDDDRDGEVSSRWTHKEDTRITNEITQDEHKDNKWDVNKHVANQLNSMRRRSYGTGEGWWTTEDANMDFDDQVRCAQ